MELFGPFEGFDCLGESSQANEELLGSINKSHKTPAEVKLSENLLS
jgi:hypothetical protein